MSWHHPDHLDRRFLRGQGSDDDDDSFNANDKPFEENADFFEDDNDFSEDDDDSFDNNDDCYDRDRRGDHQSQHQRELGRLFHQSGRREGRQAGQVLNKGSLDSDQHEPECMHSQGHGNGGSGRGRPEPGQTQPQQGGRSINNHNHNSHSHIDDEEAWILFAGQIQRGAAPYARECSAVMVWKQHRGGQRRDVGPRGNPWTEDGS